ncbi:MAG: glycosyltransferase [Anaerolineae bacterium]|nr:glycosyltransferase [Anaerolineae bacterium]
MEKQQAEQIPSFQETNSQGTQRSSSLRILFLSTWFPYPPDNGSKIRAKYLVQALSRRHKVVVAAFDPDGRSKGAGNAERRDSVDGVEVIPVPADPFRYVSAPQLAKFASPVPLACWPSAGMRKVVHRLTAAAHYDVVVAFQLPVASYARAVAETPRVFDIDVSLGFQRYQAWLGTKSPLQRFRHWLSWNKTRQYERRQIAGFAACTVVAPEELAFVRQTYQGTGARFHLSENGVDCTHNRAGIAPKTPASLVYNGALTYSANHDAMRYFLADIYPLIKQQIPEASLTITGSLSGVDLSGLALDESVHLSGYVPDVRVPVAGASVCVVPLRQGSGTRLKILEAMALGTPVVATTKGAEGLDVTPDRDILIADEPAGFAAQVLRLLRSQSLRNQLARDARLLVEQQYDWSQIGERFALLAEEVAEVQRRVAEREHAG